MGSREGRRSLAGEGRGPNEDKSSWGQWQQPRQEPGAPEGRWGTRENGPCREHTPGPAVATASRFYASGDSKVSQQGGMWEDV